MRPDGIPSSEDGGRGTGGWGWGRVSDQSDAGRQNVTEYEAWKVIFGVIFFPHFYPKRSMLVRACLTGGGMKRAR